MVRHSIPLEVRREIVRLHNDGMNQPHLAKTLNLPISSIRGVLDKFAKHGSVIDRPPTGRPPIITRPIRLFIIRQSIPEQIQHFLS